MISQINQINRIYFLFFNYFYTHIVQLSLYRMNKNTGALLRDIRNIKRNTSMFPNPQDIITSAK